jgi:hypothetical protein
MWIQKQQPSYFGSPLKHIKKKKIALVNFKAKTHLHKLVERHQSYWKLTGDTVMVLFASNIMVPLTVGSFLLILKQTNNTKSQRSESSCKSKRHRDQKQCKTYTNLYSILPVVGSKITHRSFHFLSC